MSESPHLGNTLQPIAEALIRYGLAVVIMWIGAIKFTAYEAGGIQPLVAHSPFMSWVYGLFSVQAFVFANTSASFSLLRRLTEVK